MYRYVCCIAVLLVSISLCIYGNAVAQDDVLAEFGDKKITVKDLDKVIGSLDMQKQQMIKQNPQLKEQLLRQLVQSFVIADLAKKAGYEKDADIAQQLEFFKDSFLANVYVKREIVDKIQISDDDLKAYYKAHEAELKTPEMVQARHILFRVADNASEEEKQKEETEVNHGSFQTNLCLPYTRRRKCPQTQRKEVHQSEGPQRAQSQSISNRGRQSLSEASA